MAVESTLSVTCQSGEVNNFTRFKVEQIKKNLISYIRVIHNTLPLVFLPRLSVF